jgi:hypothetical protein
MERLLQDLRHSTIMRRGPVSCAGALIAIVSRSVDSPTRTVLRLHAARGVPVSDRRGVAPAGVLGFPLTGSQIGRSL